MPPTASPAPLKWIQASVGQAIQMIPVEDVLFFISDEKYTRVQTAKLEALIRKPIKELVEELDADLFWQIHPLDPGEHQGHRRRHPGLPRPSARLGEDHHEKLEVSRRTPTSSRACEPTGTAPQAHVPVAHAAHPALPRLEPCPCTRAVTGHRAGPPGGTIPAQGNT